MMQSFEILDIVAARHWAKHHRPFNSSAALERAVKREFTKMGITAIRAQYDRNGDCIICGECGRCPGYHTPAEAQQAQALQPAFNLS